MYTRGVTCFSCHDSHGTANNADLLKPAQSLCLTCHGPTSPNGPHAATHRGAHAPRSAAARVATASLPHAANRADDRERQRAQPHVSFVTPQLHRRLQDPQSVHRAAIPSGPPAGRARRCGAGAAAHRPGGCVEDSLEEKIHYKEIIFWARSRRLIPANRFSTAVYNHSHDCTYALHRDARRSGCPDGLGVRAAAPRAGPGRVAELQPSGRHSRRGDRPRRARCPNGLKFFIRQNPRPARRVSLRLAIKAGSLYEADDQQGLAHLIEHMAFNGSAHFKPGELVLVLRVDRRAARPARERLHELRRDDLHARAADRQPEIVRRV